MHVRPGQLDKQLPQITGQTAAGHAHDFMLLAPAAGAQAIGAELKAEPFAALFVVTPARTGRQHGHLV